MNPSRPVNPVVTAVEQQQGGVTLSLHVPPDLQWFDGHFPEVSLLPGVVQTTWAIEQGRRYFPEQFERAPNFSSMSNLKFMRFIMPDARVVLQLSYAEARHELRFEFRENDQVCSSGRIGFSA